MSDEGPHQDDLKANGSEPTNRVVLVLVTPRTADEPERWEVVGHANHADKASAIKQLVGDKPGKYRAPSLRSWKGGLEIVVPDKPKVEAKAFD